MDIIEIRAKVVEIITQKLGVDAEECKDETNLQNDLGSDSLDFIEIICELERVLDIQIPDDVAENIYTVKQLVDQTFRIYNKPGEKA